MFVFIYLYIIYNIVERGRCKTTLLGTLKFRAGGPTIFQPNIYIYIYIYMQRGNQNCKYMTVYYSISSCL